MCSVTTCPVMLFNEPLVLDGGYLNRGGAAVFHEAAAPSSDELEAVLLKIITRTMRLLTHLGALYRRTGADLPRRNGHRWGAPGYSRSPITGQQLGGFA